MFVGAKHDRSQYEMITNNLYAVMLRPVQKLSFANMFVWAIAFLLKVRCPFFQEKLDTVRVAASLGIPHLSEKGYIA